MARLGVGRGLEARHHIEPDDRRPRASAEGGTVLPSSSAPRVGCETSRREGSQVKPCEPQWGGSKLTLTSWLPWEGSESGRDLD